jgi:hypothetical protein
LGLCGAVAERNILVFGSATLPERTVGNDVCCQLGLCSFSLLLCPLQLAAIDEETDEQDQRLFKLMQKTMLLSSFVVPKTILQNVISGIFSCSTHSGF